MNRLLKRLTVMSAVAVMLAGSLPAAAQPSPDAQGATDPAVRAELAAIVLDADDLPVGYTFAGEGFLSAAQVASNAGIESAALTDAGFVTTYVSVYEHAESDTRIRSYVSAWTDNAAAEAGFGLLEDESSDALTDTSIDVGQEPRELTTGTYTENDDATIGTADVTFRLGDRLVGVAVEMGDGSEADIALAMNLANRIAERGEAVQNGEAPAHTDLELPGRVVALPDDATQIQAGFLGPSEVETIYGVQGSVLSNIQASWVDAVALGEDEGTPLITVGLATFETPKDASAAVNESADIFAPLANQQPVEDASLDGTDTTVAYRYSSASAEGDALDSFRIIFAAGTDLVVIDLQGAPSEAVAADAANQLAAAQLACQGGEACTAPELPAELTGQ